MRRAYKLAKTHEEAISAMKEVAGTQLDRELFDIFLTIPKEELQACIPQRVHYGGDVIGGIDIPGMYARGRIERGIFFSHRDACKRRAHVRSRVDDMAHIA